MMTHCLRTAFRAGALLLVVGGLACEESEVIAPAMSTIVLSPTPSTILLAGGVQSVDVVITATVRNSIGVSLPGQDVRFTTTSGVLDPVGGTPVGTDSFGNAKTTLSLATQSATITAQSGSIVAPPITLNTATCQLANISISPSPVTFSNCTSQVTVTATVTDTGGNPCPGVLVSFAQVATSTPATDVVLTFQPGGDTTDTNGEAVVQVSPATTSDCGTKCSGLNVICTGQFQGSSGTVKSSPSTRIDDQVP
jgi:hypothetical protein